MRLALEVKGGLVGPESFTYRIEFYVWVDSVRIELNSQTHYWHLRIACWCGEVSLPWNWVRNPLQVNKNTAKPILSVSNPRPILAWDSQNSFPHLHLPPAWPLYVCPGKTEITSQTSRHAHIQHTCTHGPERDTSGLAESTKKCQKGYHFTKLKRLDFTERSRVRHLKVKTPKAVDRESICT